MYVEATVSLRCTYDSAADAAYIYLEHPIPPNLYTHAPSDFDKRVREVFDQPYSGDVDDK
ncbi:hypothetical protein AB0M47_00905 [Hamadaea sp. NPDC051192]|uniref:hypothetical protein n=1 Tax=Hamadaea sp. NPDC051192 TaxID=3154940 RepID=UPI00341A3B9B